MRGRHAACLLPIAALLASPAFAQVQVPAAPPVATPTPAPAVPPLTPAQQAAVVLGNWETCIDLAAQFLAYSKLSSKGSVVIVVRKCAYFEAQVRPVLAQSLREMMYGSSEAQVSAQTEVAIDSLRRHITARATAAVARVRAR
ncbi:MAG: hypothetical protein Q7J32_17695 [Sphingomonadaceae bacterium]|nr:hypothetical protein [Sphingomonadaceae bacterium]